MVSFKKSIICHICKEVKDVGWKGIYMCSGLETHQNTGCSRLLEHTAWAGTREVWAGEVARALSATPGGLASFFQ